MGIPQRTHISDKDVNPMYAYKQWDTIETYMEYQLLSTFDRGPEQWKIHTNTYPTPEEAIKAYTEQWGKKLRDGEKLTIISRLVSNWKNHGNITLT
jgi:hypothetical protein